MISVICESCGNFGNVPWALLATSVEGRELSCTSCGSTDLELNQGGTKTAIRDIHIEQVMGKRLVEATEAEIADAILQLIPYGNYEAARITALDLAHKLKLPITAAKGWGFTEAGEQVPMDDGDRLVDEFNTTAVELNPDGTYGAHINLGGDRWVWMGNYESFDEARRASYEAWDREALGSKTASSWEHFKKSLGYERYEKVIEGRQIALVVETSGRSGGWDWAVIQLGEYSQDDEILDQGEASSADEAKQAAEAALSRLPVGMDSLFGSKKTASDGWVESWEQVSFYEGLRESALVAIKDTPEGFRLEVLKYPAVASLAGAGAGWAVYPIRNGVPASGDDDIIAEGSSETFEQAKADAEAAYSAHINANQMSLFGSKKMGGWLPPRSMRDPWVKHLPRATLNAWGDGWAVRSKDDGDTLRGGQASDLEDARNQADVAYEQIFLSSGGDQMSLFGSLTKASSSDPEWERGYQDGWDDAVMGDPSNLDGRETMGYMDGYTQGYADGQGRKVSSLDKEFRKVVATQWPEGQPSAYQEQPEDEEVMEDLEQTPGPAPRTYDEDVTEMAAEAKRLNPHLSDLQAFDLAIRASAYLDKAAQTDLELSRD